MLLIHNASQVLTIAGKPQRGQSLGNLGIIEHGAILIDNDRIAALGDSQQLISAYPFAERLDAQGNVVMPGFVDPHTHLIWAGDRANEFDLRQQGKPYLEILAAGGGILSTVMATRAASLDEIVGQSHQRLLQAFNHGTTTMEVKTGYGLDVVNELKMLEAILTLNSMGPVDLVATFMGAHAIPPEFKNNPDTYTTWLCQEMLPIVCRWWNEKTSQQPLPFVDVFCEEGAFSLAHTHQILESASSLGFPLKLHVDEFKNLGGASLAAELGAVSADHLVKTSAEDIRKLASCDTVAVSLPGTPFGLGQNEYTPAGEIIAANGILALASDLNPGTTWNESMQMVIALACRYMHLTPAQAIAASTINAAAAINRSDQIGSLEPGKQADLLILNCPNFNHLGYRYGTNLVSFIIKKGRVYSNG